MQVDVYYDYTCPYSYKVFLWIEQLRRVVPDFTAGWKTFSLKEANRSSGSPTAFGESPGISVVALALAHAARGADFGRYHTSVYQAMHADGSRLDEDQLLQLAGAAGVDVEAFVRDRSGWVDAVAREHTEGSARWEVFGTPTLILEAGTAVFLKFSDPPETDEEAADLWASLCRISVCHPELIEIKRPG